MKLRRWLLDQKELLPKEGNLVLINKALKNMGLKSLVEIKKKFSDKNKRKTGKSGKNKQRTSQFNIKRLNLNWGFNLEKYEQKLIFEQLNQLTNSLKKIERKLSKIEKKLEKENKPKNKEK